MGLCLIVEVLAGLCASSIVRGVELHLRAALFVGVFVRGLDMRLCVAVV